ncbi:hypothetical protein KL921_004760 [Ogataea angusta]|uniref:histone acetyltransferase n=1 Tax=Pichia angusta TaxID=870730 RepID=A0AAN6DB27_PICAN|nr:uncharacterized protein KL928_005300 [Ogataea angusta]KAG7806363.1 hypothetical protein KL921_004760 [Ogataea angusta]KAG7815961.1 hypothetical protein KL928_005300 [Ogataea angusta]KAG7820701.1 hypothetical protein KL909_004573 [Ogataea angusta]KAG7827090.1 hypothetical protein KL920_005088 [Ogataea angusta]KAG7832627.1 hypothetical protein KL943_004964 [Ogataea angusta]
MTNSNDLPDYGSLNYRNVERVTLGSFEFNTWFGNSVIFFPSEPQVLGYQVLEKKTKLTSSIKKVSQLTKERIPWIKKLSFCPYCFRYTTNADDSLRHLSYCSYKRNLPGQVMYLDDVCSIRRVNGKQHKLFCQCMSILAKFFLDNKSVFFNVDLFDFFVIYQTLDGVSTPMGFYSRELVSWEQNNLSCIFVIPCYQKQRLGSKLIEFSYYLSNHEQIISGPERPLSPFGKLAYLSYWCRSLSRELLYGRLSTFDHVTLELMSFKTGFRSEDILLTLDYMQALYETGEKFIYTDYYSNPCRKNQNFVFLEDAEFRMFIDKAKIRNWVINHNISAEPNLDPQYLLLD